MGFYNWLGQVKIWIKLGFDVGLGARHNYHDMQLYVNSGYVVQTDILVRFVQV